MSYDSVYYWKNFLQKGKEFGVKMNSISLNFAIVSQSSSNIYHDWLSFPGKKALVGYLKYVVLPSGYISSLFGGIDSDFTIDSVTFNEAIELLENNTYKIDKQLIANFKEDYYLLTKIEQEEINIMSLKDFCNSYNLHLGINNMTFSLVNVYENIKDVGYSLIKDYEEDGMIDELEDQFGMSIDQIYNMFDSIQDNEFMLYRINEFLKNRTLFL